MTLPPISARHSASMTPDSVHPLALETLLERTEAEPGRKLNCVACGAWDALPACLLHRIHSRPTRLGRILRNRIKLRRGHATFAEFTLHRRATCPEAGVQSLIPCSRCDCATARKKHHSIDDSLEKKGFHPYNLHRLVSLLPSSRFNRTSHSSYTLF